MHHLASMNNWNKTLVFKVFQKVLCSVDHHNQQSLVSGTEKMTLCYLSRWSISCANLLSNEYTGLILGLCPANERRQRHLSLAGHKPIISPHTYIWAPESLWAYITGSFSTQSIKQCICTNSKEPVDIVFPLVNTLTGSQQTMRSLKQIMKKCLKILSAEGFEGF